MKKVVKNSFYPCFNGIRVRTQDVDYEEMGYFGFYPCFNGIRVRTQKNII